MQKIDEDTEECILALLAQGKSHKAIAAYLCVDMEIVTRVAGDDAPRVRIDVDYEPTLAEIKEGCRKVRGEGFINDRGEKRHPWDAADERKRRGEIVQPVEFPRYQSSTDPVKTMWEPVI